MRRADGLLLFQGAQCNRQIPAKAYEYLACRRPIIGLIDSSGDTYDLVAHQWKCRTSLTWILRLASPMCSANLSVTFAGGMYSFRTQVWSNSIREQ